MIININFKKIFKNIIKISFYPKTQKRMNLLLKN